MNLGSLFLSISLIGSIFTIIISFIMRKGGKKEKLRDWFFIITSLGLTASLILILYYQFTCNFKYTYVVEHISRDLKPIYRISALWAGQSGSFLLWAVISIWLGFFIKSNNKAFNIYMIITTAIILFVYLSNPFAIEKNFPIEGRGLNIALQNPWMAVHPPLVFIGYSAMGILFSQSFSNIVERKWIFISLIFLGVGIFTGSIWAYNALGWGGYWAWDPIENAALVPWLILIVIMHKEKVKPYTTMIPFILAIFGTFLARSGVLKGKSVHSYTASTMSTPILVLIVFLSLAMLLIALKHSKKKQVTTLKRSLMIFCNLTYFFAAIILVATTLPIFSPYNLESGFYNLISLVFVVISSILFLIYMKDLVSIKLPLSLIINTVLVMIISMITAFGKIEWLTLLWILTFPLSLKIIYFNKFKNRWANIGHIGFMLMIIGSVISSVFGETGMLLEAKRISEETVKTNISHNLLGDIIITEGCKYSTKPLIYLFWLGGALIIIAMVGVVGGNSWSKAHSNK